MARYVSHARVLDNSTSLLAVAWYHKSTNHYLKQRRPRSLTYNCVTRRMPLSNDTLECHKFPAQQCKWQLCGQENCRKIYPILSKIVEIIRRVIIIHGTYKDTFGPASAKTVHKLFMGSVARNLVSRTSPRFEFTILSKPYMLLHLNPLMRCDA